MNDNKTYWKILMSLDEGLKIVTLQDFDEDDYEEDEFLHIKFDSPREAKRVVSLLQKSIMKTIILSIMGG